LPAVTARSASPVISSWRTICEFTQGRNHSSVPCATRASTWNTIWRPTWSPTGKSDHARYWLCFCCMPRGPAMLYTGCVSSVCHENLTMLDIGCVSSVCQEAQPCYILVVLILYVRRPNHVIHWLCVFCQEAQPCFEPVVVLQFFYVKRPNHVKYTANVPPICQEAQQSYILTEFLLLYAKRSNHVWYWLCVFCMPRGPTMFDTGSVSSVCQEVQPCLILVVFLLYAKRSNHVWYWLSLFFYMPRGPTMFDTGSVSSVC